MRLLDLLYPPRCPVCDDLRPPGEPVCHPSCRKKLTPVGDVTCVRCGKPVPDVSVELCFDCAAREESAFSRGVAAYVYEDEIRESMMRFKFLGREEYGVWYAEELFRMHSREFADFGAEAVVPVPIHAKKLRTRGYNQAEVIAAELAERLSLPLYARFLRRNRYTPPQKALNNHERIRNLCRALEPGPQAKRLLAKQKTPRRILLVDDIYTTGSTLEACSLVLKTAGVEHIMVATVCIGSGYA